MSLKDEAESEAIRRFKRGEQPSYSTDITGKISCGYGELDDLGFWEFPLPPEYWPIKDI